jgi:hypothetical protein
MHITTANHSILYINGTEFNLLSIQFEEKYHPTKIIEIEFIINDDDKLLLNHFINNSINVLLYSNNKYIKLINAVINDILTSQMFFDKPDNVYTIKIMFDDYIEIEEKDFNFNEYILELI